MKFYVLEPSPNDTQTLYRTDYLEVEPHHGEATYCGACGGLISPLKWLPPFKAELELWGKGYGDMAFFFAEEILVSQHFLGGYKKYGLKGLEGFEPVEVVKVKKHRRFKQSAIPKYYHATVIRSGAAIDLQKSGLELEDPGPVCAACRLSRKGIRSIQRIVLEPSTWTGEDIFIARGEFSILVSERFKDFCEEYQIKNSVLIPAEEYSFDFYKKKDE